MSPRHKSWLGNLGLASLSVMLTFAVLEHVVFRYILPPDDLVENVTVNGVVRYAPNTRATFRHPDGRTSLVTINADGWNSTKPRYETAHTPGMRRIAVIGDSYVHGAIVDVGEGFPEVMERDLKARGGDVEVLRFGMDGAPLSQYLHVLRSEVLAYKPDIVLVPLIHNDFDESYRFLKTRYASSFMKLKRGEDGRVIEVPPGEFQYGVADSLRGYRTFRYLYYETNLYLHAKGFISRYFWGGDEQWSPEFISSAVDIRRIADHQANRYFTRYLMAEMKKLAIEHGFRLAFIMDGVREAVYADRPASSYEVGMLNRIAADVARELDLPFLDLQETFERDWRKHRQRFEYAYDWHWNARANKLVAEAANGLLTADRRIGLWVSRRAAGIEKPAGNSGQREF